MSRLSSQTSTRGAPLFETLLSLLVVLAFLVAPLKLFGNSWLSYLTPDILAAVILIVVLSDRLARGKPLIGASPLSVPLMVLVIVCALELANPEAPFIRSVFGLRSWLLYLGFYFVGLYMFQSEKQLERLYILLLSLGVATAIYGVYQWRAGPQSFAGWSDYYGLWARLAWIAHTGSVFRAFSTFVNPGTFALNMALLMLMAFSVTLSSKVSVPWRVLAACGFVIMSGAIAVSGSRGPAALLLIAGAMALVLIPGAWSRVGVAVKVLVMAGVAVSVGTFLVGPVVGERFYTIFDLQIAFWKWFAPFLYGLSIASEHPLGMGLGYTAGVPRFTSNPAIRELPTTNIDSGYGSVAAELGFLGLLVFAYFAAKVGIEAFRSWRSLRPGRLRDLLLGPALMACTYPIVLVIFQPQAALPSAIYFWLLVGVLMKAPALQKEQDAH